MIGKLQRILQFQWRRNIIPLLAAPFWVAAGLPAAAEFAVCNQSFDVVNLAIGQYQRDSFVTEGWWTVGPNQCANVIDEPLKARYIYVFAQDVFGNGLLNGTTPMCINTKRFSIRGERDCLLRGYLETQFLEVDTQWTERWTLFVAAPVE